MTSDLDLDVDDPGVFDHRYADVNGIRMHYIDEGEGPLVILLHGFPFLWYLWRHQIKVLAAAGYRVVAPDQRGYGQTDAPDVADEYDMTYLVGDVVGLVKAVGAESAILVGHDFGSWVGYNCLAMRPDLFRGLFMMCSPSSPRPAISPVEGFKNFPADLEFYQEYFSRPDSATEIMQDIRGYITGIYYSVSGACTDDEQWRAFWKKGVERFEDTYTIPETLPPFMNERVMDYVVGEFERRGIQGPLNWYAAQDSTWRHTSFLDGVVVRQPAVFLTGDRDPSAKPLFGTNRQADALAGLPTTYPNLQKIITLTGVGHTPPDEKPAEVNEALLEFLESVRHV